MPSVLDPQYRQDLEDLYQEYLAAEKIVVKAGQEYTIKDRTLKRADLKFIAEEKRRIANELAKLDAGGKVRMKRGVIRYDS